MANVVGIEKVSYISKKSGNQVEGYRVHCTEENENVTGVEVINEFISREYLSIKSAEEVLGSEIRFLYNKFGRCVGMEEVR